ncbi:hypothetical protein PR048_012051 [Dryococelus australis]|uniref:Peptidase A2 domain-containing protein n=1 Tax=Dryococelus australis TaxID=614101 RepID=A0ABQ9HNI5_9NEOP|nr:hypothetical protein PR048_012051 [Dryococelus australis]
MNNRQMQNKQDFSVKCRQCNFTHTKAKCPAVGEWCHNCGKLNHFAVMCRNFGENKSSDEDYYVVNGITVLPQNLKHVECVRTQEKSTKWHEIIAVEDRKLNFKLDTGSDVNILPENLF